MVETREPERKNETMNSVAQAPIPISSDPDMAAHESLGWHRERVKQLETELHDERNRWFGENLKLQTSSKHFRQRLNDLKDLVQELPEATLVEAGICPAHYEPMDRCGYQICCGGHEHTDKDCEVYREILREEREARRQAERELA